MANVDWGQEVRPSVHDLIAAVNELESYTDVEREVTGTFLTRNVLDGVSDEAEIQEIKGNSIVWHQPIQMSSRNVTASGVTFACVENGYFTLDGTATATNSFTVQLTNGNGYKFIPGHKYIIRGGDRAKSVSIYPQGLNTNIYPDNIYTKTGESMSGSYLVAISNGVTYDNYKGYLQVFDLTAMFSAGNEPATAAEFDEQYPEEFYPYTPEPILLDANIAGINDLAFPQKTLRGIGTAQDVMTGSGIERVIGVFLPTGDGIVQYGANAEGYMRARLKLPSDAYAKSPTPTVGNQKSDKLSYSYGTYNYGHEFNFSLSGSDVWITFDATAYPTIEDAETWLDSNAPVIEYELATPTTEQFAEPIDLTYSVQEGGTETWIIPTGNAPTSTAPTATIRYKMEYEYELITEKSFDNFCDALGTALSLDISKEWNATTKEWDFTITQAASSLHSIRESEVAGIEEPIELSKDEVLPIEKEVEITEPVKEVDGNE